MRMSFSSRWMPNSNHVTPVSGHAMKIQVIGRSASSEVWFHPNCTNLMPYQTNTSANTSTKTIETMRSAALRARLAARGHTSTSKCVASRTPIIAPSITIQMKRKRAISSVQIQAGMSAVKREIICSVTGTTSIADADPEQHVEEPGVVVDELAHALPRYGCVGKKRPAQGR